MYHSDIQLNILDEFVSYNYIKSVFIIIKLSQLRALKFNMMSNYYTPFLCQEHAYMIDNLIQEHGNAKCINAKCTY